MLLPPDSNSRWEVLNSIQEAIERDARTQAASIAGEATDDGYRLHSLFVSVEAVTEPEARSLATSIVASALASLGHESDAEAVGVYDEEGRFVGPNPPDIANPS